MEPTALHDFLDQFVVRSDDVAAKKRIARALLLAFPDPSQERELTHARAVLAPIYGDLTALATNVEGNLSIEDRKQDESFLTVAIVVAHTEFLPDIQGYEGRRQCFRALVELIAADRREARSHLSRLVGAAIRDDLETRCESGKATSVAPLPDFKSVLQLVQWFDNGENLKHPFAKPFRQQWESLSRKLRFALFNPVPPPGQDDAEDEDSADAGQIIPPSNGADIEPALQPSRQWIPPEPSTHAERIRSSGTQETIAKIGLSTITPISKFTTASTTVISDAQMRSEIIRLLEAADAVHAARDPTAESLYLARALVPATATLGKWVTALRWNTPEASQDASFLYPGVITQDAEWLIRPELQPSRRERKEQEVRAAGTVWIPLPRALSVRLLRLCGPPQPGSSVFPILTTQARALSVDATERTPSLTALRRTLVSRLMRAEPLGITGAQWVAGDDFGLDDAPLYYDRIDADRMASIVARITFPWFGEDPSPTRKTRPSHSLGSRRLPDIKQLHAFHASLHDPPSEQASGLASRLRRRTRNLVHGLAAFSGHRPNDKFTELRLGDFGIEDPIATISDKEVSADWQTRPIAVPKIWRDELQYLVNELAQVASTYPGTPLAHEVESALARTGPIFLDILNEHEVAPFGLAAYRRGVPDELLSINNYARQMLNNRLIGAVPEVLRVGQMGWHGTREGAWADGSPWSVLSAAAALEKPLSQVLKDVGWRPLGPAGNPPTPVKESPLAWLEREAAHRIRFRAAATKGKRSLAERHSKCAKEQILPRLTDFLRENFPTLQLSEKGLYPHAKPGGGAAIQFSVDDAKRLIDFLCAGDHRSIEAVVARNLLSAFIRDARKKGIVEGPIPRRVISHWPERPGAFFKGQPQALRDFRALDALVCATGTPISEAARAACALLLHGGYGDVDCVLSAMKKGSMIHSLQSEPGILLIEPVRMADKDIDSESQGCLAFHGLAALHAWRWHRQNADPPPEEEIDQEIYSILPPSMRPAQAKETLRQIAALARACNALRMDGWARLVGTNIAHPVTAPAERVIALRDAKPMAATRIEPGSVPYSPPATETESEAEPTHLPRPLLDHLYRELTAAVQSIDTDSRNDAQQRNSLRKTLSIWMSRVSTLSPAGLLVRYTIALLDRGGKHKQQLLVRTIRDYVEAIGKPLVKALPDNPLQKSAEEWETAYENAVAQTSKTYRRARARALARFHWTLSQEFNMPEVSFAGVHALCDGASDVADAGFATDAEIKGIVSMLRRDIADADCAGGGESAIHIAKARLVSTTMAAATALRPGEIERLQDPLISIDGSNGFVEIRKTPVQRTKTGNSRRRVCFRGPLAATAVSLASQWKEANRIRAGSSWTGHQFFFHEVHDPNRRLDGGILFSRTSQLLRWATGLAHARPYWLRKGAIRIRLEHFQRSAPSTLWEFRDLIAEAAHGEPTVTLNWYTHDPVTAFLRWFETGWDNLSAERLSIASGRSLSAIARRRAGRGLTTAGRDVRVRVATLLQQLQSLDSHRTDTLIRFPDSIAPPPHDDYVFRNLHAALRQIASGKSIHEVLHAWSWPQRRIEALEQTLNRLEADYKISIRTVREGSSGLLNLNAPRQLSQDGGIGDLMGADGAMTVLAEMADSWLRTAQLSGAPNGIPCTVLEWNRWIERMPALKRIAWTQQDFGRALKLMIPDSDGPKKVGPWPLLRWSLLMAWIARATQTADGLASQMK